MTSEQFSSRKDFDTAVATVEESATAYYHGTTLTITDADYDTLIDRIEVSVAANPSWDARGVLTQVAAGTIGGGSVTHPTPMLSMEKSTVFAEIKDFTANLSTAVVVEVKMDGISIRATYVDGTLSALTTRGDGVVGEPVNTDLAITGLPRTIDLAGTVDVRGEIFMTDEDFGKSNANRVASGKAGFANPRNATAGTVRRETVTYEAFLSFAAFELIADNANDDYVARMDTLSTAGFTTILALTQSAGVDTTATTDPATVIDRITTIGAARNALAYGIDGAVVKAVSTRSRNAIGVGSRAPKWAHAYKYPAVEVSSVLRDIEITVGKTGRQALTAIIDPVVVDGSTVSRATLHNPAFITEQKLGLGSRVIVEKRGDIIPRVTSALHADNANVAVWTPPAVHDVCGEPWDTSEVNWRCTTPECSQVGRVVYFASRDSLDIDGLGEEIATALVETGTITTVADLYDLTVAQIAGVQIGTTTTGKPKLIGTTVATKLVAEIEGTKTQPLNRVITSLSIRKMGRTMGRRVAAHYKSLAAIRAASISSFENVDGVAEEKARYYHEGFAANSAILDRLVAAGITTTVPTADDTANTTAVDFTGSTYVVSGSVPGYTRTTISERIEALGGKSSSSVTAKTTALVTETGATSSKAKKAAQLGIPIIDPTEFAALIAE